MKNQIIFLGDCLAYANDEDEKTLMFERLQKVLFSHGCGWGEQVWIGTPRRRGSFNPYVILGLERSFIATPIIVIYNNEILPVIDLDTVVDFIRNKGLNLVGMLEFCNKYEGKPIEIDGKAYGIERIKKALDFLEVAESGSLAMIRQELIEKKK